MNSSGLRPSEDTTVLSPPCPLLSALSMLLPREESAMLWGRSHQPLVEMTGVATMSRTGPKCSLWSPFCEDATRRKIIVFVVVAVMSP